MALRRPSPTVAAMSVVRENPEMVGTGPDRALMTVNEHSVSGC
jgi:hypothetical protein